MKIYLYIYILFYLLNDKILNNNLFFILLFKLLIKNLFNINCLIGQPKLIEFALKMFSYITTKDYDRILPAVLSSISDIIAAIKACI